MLLFDVCSVTPVPLIDANTTGNGVEYFRENCVHNCFAALFSINDGVSGVCGDTSDALDRRCGVCPGVLGDVPGVVIDDLG